MKEQAISIPSGDLKLEGLLATPTAGASVRGAVVCHPHPLYGGSMHNNVVEAALEALWRLGYATLRFNFRGVGGSDGEHSGGVGEADDAKAALRCLLAQPGIVGDGAVMAGYSFGAAVAMRAGVELKEVGTILAIALPVGMSDFSSLVTNGKKIVLVAGDRDSYCPERAIKTLAQSSGAKLDMIDGADHFFGGYEEVLADEIAKLLGA
ncbi:MAG TPA: alpha/beta fold hydrolase [Candidatus Binataceae bacterium]|nr:alpha/beta fold hydrolase [Candidatus Binataceae bacterium]